MTWGDWQCCFVPSRLQDKFQISVVHPSALESLVAFVRAFLLFWQPSLSELEVSTLAAFREKPLLDLLKFTPIYCLSVFNSSCRSQLSVAKNQCSFYAENEKYFVLFVSDGEEEGTTK